MWLALHAFHIAMIVVGAVVVCVLLRPRRPGNGRRARVLRAAQSPEQIRELAYARARAELSDSPAAPARLRVRVLRAAVFAVVGAVLGTAAHRLAEGGWPPLWLIIASAAALGLVGYLAYRRPRPAWHWALVVTGSQVLLNAAYSLNAILSVPRGASTADWARLLFCYHGQAVPSTAQVIAARNALGAGAVKLLPSGSGGAADSMLIWAGVAHFAAAVLLGAFVMWGEPLLARLRAATRARRGEDQRSGSEVVTRARGWVPVG